ncbi:MAG TPA: PspC domain-containing protein [Acidimicrobiia bacterium]|nr:PspC domain-containing protein [Acidimicrobiia bacterium]
MRPSAGRAIAGVAAGLANYLGVSTGLVRFGFLLAIVFGGLGIALYLAGWLLIRDEAEPTSIAQRVFDNLGSGPSWIGIGLLILGAVIVLDNFTFLSGSLIWAVVLVTVGFLLYRGDIGPRSDTESRPAPDTSAAGIVDRPVTGSEPPPAPPSGARPVPSSPPTPPPPPPPPSILGRLTIGVGLLALGALAVIDNVTPLVDPQPRHYLALATVVLGLGLITGAFVGRARWMILLGIFLLPPLVASPAAEVEWDGRFDRTVAPTDPTELGGRYEGAAGRYVFDLTDSDWNGESVTLDVELAAGNIVVLLPPDVGLTGTASVAIGAVEGPDGSRGGLGDISRNFDIPGDSGNLDVDLEIGAGVIEIHTDGRERSSIDHRVLDFGAGRITFDERNR